MRQDIKTFSDLTTIKTTRKLNVHIKLRKHGRTVSKVRLNGFAIFVDELSMELDLLDQVKLEIELTDFDEGTSGIEVEVFTVNGNEVLPKFQHLTSSGNNYIDELGLWTLEIPAPFYPWHHTISGQGLIA
jgi:hypothetical protein